jgi:hypothetical protein
MTTLVINDLKPSEELDFEAMSLIRGGSNTGIIGGQEVADSGVLSMFSPTIVVKADTLLQFDADTLVNVLSPLSSIMAA